MFHVAIVSPKRSMEPINQVISEYNFGCQFYKYVYNDLSDIDCIYADCKDKCDVIFFSGELGYHYIRGRFPDIQIPCAFTAYGPRDILSILLDFSIEHPEIPLNRVFVDFLTPKNNFMDLPRYVKAEYLPYFFDDSPYDYTHITARTRELWDAGKIDIVISRSINNLHTLDELHIPYLAVFPSEQMIKESIEAALVQLRLADIEPVDYLTISIRLPFSDDCPQEEREYRLATLHKILVDYRKNTGRSFSIREGLNQFELHSQHPAQTITHEQIRQIAELLREQFEYPFRMGAGLHSNEDRSCYYAERALLEAVRYGRRDGFFICGEDSTMTGPLATGQTLSYPQSDSKIRRFARQHGINESNLLKLAGVFRSDPNSLLTSAIVSRLLGITSRSASRILQKLTMLGLTVSVSTEKSGGKGRPIHYYRFSDDAFREALLS